MLSKALTRMVESPVWQEDHPTVLVWFTCVATMDEEGLLPFSAVANLARRARVTDKEAAWALERLQSDELGLILPDGKPWVVLDPERHIVRPGDGRMVGPEWAATRKRIFERDGYACRYCKRKDLALDCDHILPISRGGTNHDGNLTASCYACNRSKGNRTPEEWRGVALG